jgi:hypothetical protein
LSIDYFNTIIISVTNLSVSYLNAKSPFVESITVLSLVLVTSFIGCNVYDNTVKAELMGTVDNLEGDRKSIFIIEIACDATGHAFNCSMTTGFKLDPVEPIEECKITAGWIGEGIISVNEMSPLDPGDGSEFLISFPCGTTVSIEAEPVKGWFFSGWSGDIANSSET